MSDIITLDSNRERASVRLLLGIRDLSLFFTLALDEMFTGENLKYRGLYRLAIVVFFISAFLASKPFWKEKNLEKSGTHYLPFLAWLTLFVAYSASSVMWARFPSYVIESHVSTVIAYVLLLTMGLSFTLVDSKSFCHVISIYIAASTFLLVVVKYMDMTSGVTSERLGDSLKVNANALGLQFSFALMGALALLRTDHEEKKRRVMIAAIVLLFIGVALTQSRKAAAMVLAGLFCFTVYDNRRYVNVRRLLVSFTLVAFLFAVIGLTPSLRDGIGQRMLSLVSGLGSDGAPDASLAERSFYFATAMSLFRESPILGIGFGGFAAYMNYIGYWHQAYSHNNYGELLATLGILGIVIYYSFYYTILKRAYRAFRKGESIGVLILYCMMIEMVCELGYVSFVSTSTYFIIYMLHVASHLLDSRLACGC